jgi:hypothetical protein
MSHAYEIQKLEAVVRTLEARNHELQDAERDMQRWREYAIHLEGGGSAPRESFGITGEAPS